MMANKSQLYCAIALYFALIATTTMAAAVPAPTMMVRQPKATQAMQRRSTCVGVGQCVDGSSNENTSGLVINFSNDPSSSSTESPQATTTRSSSSSSSATGLDCVTTQTAADGTVNVNGQGCSIGNISIGPSGIGNNVGGSTSTPSTPSSTSSPSNGVVGISSSCSSTVGMAMMAVLIGACIML